MNCTLLPWSLLWSTTDKCCKSIALISYTRSGYLTNAALGLDCCMHRIYCLFYGQFGLRLGLNLTVYRKMSLIGSDSKSDSLWARESSACAAHEMEVVDVSAAGWQLAAHATDAAAACLARFCDAATCSRHSRPTDPFGYFLGFAISVVFGFNGAVLFTLGIFLGSHFVVGAAFLFTLGIFLGSHFGFGVMAT